LLRGEEWSTWKREFYGFVCNCCQLSLISRVGCNLISDDDFTSSIIYSCKHVFNSKRPLAATHVSLFCRVAPIQTYISSHLFSFFYQNRWPDQFARTSTNPRLILRALKLMIMQTFSDLEVCETRTGDL